jgi:hypothetical protein
MDWTRVEGNWKQMKGTVKERWGKLTDDDLTAIAGRRDLPSSALLKSSSLMLAQEQQTLSLMPRKRSSGTRSLLSPSHWAWDF